MERKPIHRNSLLFGDCLELLRMFPDNHFTAVVTDPPYGLSAQPDMREVLKHWLAGDDYQHRGAGFMGKSWDSFVPGPKVWEEIFRVLKPGGHVLSFGGTRTYDLMVTAMRLAAFEVRDKIDFYCQMEEPKSWTYGSGFPKSHNIGKAVRKSGKVTDGDNPWDGYGTALKPAHEPIADFSKGGEPVDVDVPFQYIPKVATKERNLGCKNLFWHILDGGRHVRISKEDHERMLGENETHKDDGDWKKHRIAKGNVWPTVKPIELARYLVRLVKMPESNSILDPFMGSGTTMIGCILEGCDYIGMDNDPIAYQIAESRVRYFKCLGERGLK